jgi:hypothetical protein
MLAQDVEVTFYSAGSLWAYAKPVTDGAAFAGYVYDGRERLAFLHPQRFFTLRLPAGPHVFSASLSGKHPADNSSLPVTLVEGKSYFVRSLLDLRGVVVISTSKGHLDEVTCDVAHHEAERSRALEERYVSKSWRDKVVATASLPNCP